MPYPNEHSCRLLDPDQFVRFFRKHVKDTNDVGDYQATGKAYDLIIGYREDESSDTQAHRYPKDTWTEAQARKHCKAHDGKSFEPAKEEKSAGPRPMADPVLDSSQGPREMERRSFPLRELRIEPVADSNQRKIVGYAAVFDMLSEPLWGFQEKIRKGAFAKTIGEADIRALFNHDENYVLGRKKAGTLKLWEDDIGLGIEILPPDTQWARDLVVTMERGDVDQMSFSFRVLREEWSHTPSQEIRTLIEVELRDVSPVTFPAYPQTIAQVRSVFGVEVRTVSEALSRLEAGSMTEADVQLLRQLLDSIQNRLTAAPDPGAHPAEDPQDPPNALAHRRRQLELAERL